MYKLNKEERCLLLNDNTNMRYSRSNTNVSTSLYGSNMNINNFKMKKSYSTTENIYPSFISNYVEFVKFVSNKNESTKKFSNLTKTELLKIVDYNRRMQSELKYSNLDVNLGSAKITLYEQKKIKYIMININKIEKKLFELIRWASIAFPTNFEIGLIMYK
ncbi:hypothetical protein Yalta_065 [Yalta virus]|nr:hypothetical protein Yalta_065 [Yalta virus]